MKRWKLVCVALLLAIACKPTPTVETLQLVDGWIGGDAAYSRVLSNGQRIWLFGDSFVGHIQLNKRVNATMYRNAAAMETAEGLRYFWGHSEAGLFPAPEAQSWYWPADAIEYNGELYVFLRLMEQADPKDPLGFKRVGNDLAVVSNPFAPPSAWRVRHKPVEHDQLMLAVAVAIKGAYLYLLSDDETNRHGLYLSRLTLENLHALDFSEMEFFDKATGEWVKEQPATPFFTIGSPEASLVFDESRGVWRTVFTPAGISKDIVMMESATDDITGEWSAPVTIFSCKEMDMNPNYICYAGKEIPGRGSAESLEVTYSVNSLKFEDLETDARIYIPRIAHIPRASFE